MNLPLLYKEFDDIIRANTEPPATAILQKQLDLLFSHLRTDAEVQKANQEAYSELAVSYTDLMAKQEAQHLKTQP